MNQRAANRLFARVADKAVRVRLAASGQESQTHRSRSSINDLRAFVEANHFNGKPAAYLNTCNSEFGNDHIADFRAAVMARGVASFQHHAMKRGRMGSQLAPDTMLGIIDQKWQLRDWPNAANANTH